MSIAQLASKIEKVKVYAEGSTVRRLANLSEIAGQIDRVTEQIEVEIIGLPLALDDASVRVRVDNIGTDGNVIVTDVRVGLSVPTPVEVPQSDLEASIQTAKAEVDRLTDLHSVIALEMAALNVLNVPDRPIGEEGKAPPTSPTGARVALANFKDEQQKLRIKEKRTLDLQLRTATEKLADLKQQQNLASNANVAKENELRKTIIARLQLSDRQAASLPGLDNLQLIIEYFVQGAKWTPTYVCRLNSATNTAAIALRALICQRTGEDWSGVQIELSTATPTAWCELPELPSLRLGRSQTFAAKKAWRNPPQGAEILFEDYDLQRQIAYKAISTDSVAQNFQIPTLQPLSVVTQSSLNQEIEYLADLQVFSCAGQIPEFDSMSPEVDAELAELKRSIQESSISSGGSAAAYAAERMEDMVLMSRSAPAPAKMATRSVKFKAMAPPGAMSEAMRESVLDPVREIKNYGSMRLGDPVDPLTRGKLSLPDAKTIYLESLKRFSKGEATPTQMTVNFDLAEALATALRRAACQNTHLPAGAINVRQMAGAFDFAYLGTGRVDIPSDGQFHSVALLTENAEIDLRYIVVPREDTNVFRIAQLRNPLRSPLLAGATDVYVDGEYILSTRIDTVPPQGQMELGLGVEQSIKVARNTAFQEVRSGESLVAFNELRHSIQIAIANRLKRDAKIEVRERIPVPQADAKVDVTVTQVAPAWEKYEQQERNALIQGGYRWQIDVPAGGETELTVDYTIKTFVDNELVNGNRREE